MPNSHNVKRLSSFRQRGLAAFDLVVPVSNLNHGVNQISFVDQAKRRLEEFPLKSRLDVRNNDYKSGVQRSSTVKGQKIYPVVGNKRVIPLHNEFHEVPVFGAAEAQIGDMIGSVPRRMCKFEQGYVQAFVNEQFCHYAFVVLGYRVTRIGFCFVQGW